MGSGLVTLQGRDSIIKEQQERGLGLSVTLTIMGQAAPHSANPPTVAAATTLVMLTASSFATAATATPPTAALPVSKETRHSLTSL